MNIDVKLSDGAVLPSGAHASDTGYDLIAISEPKIVGEKVGDHWRRVDYIEYDTGVSVAPEILYETRFAGFNPKDESYNPWPKVAAQYGYLLVYPRSSISKTNLTLCNSVAIIDNSYRGTIKLRFRYLLQPTDIRVFGNGSDLVPYEVVTKIDQSRIYQRGDKIGQAVAAWKEDIKWRAVNELNDTARQDGGFGSSGT